MIYLFAQEDRSVGKGVFLNKTDTNKYISKKCYRLSKYVYACVKNYFPFSTTPTDFFLFYS